MELIWVVLPFLALLACPLMMVFCMRGMRRPGAGSSCASGTTASAQTREERIETLERQLGTIQGELASLRAEEVVAPAVADEAPRPGQPAPVAS